MRDAAVACLTWIALTTPVWPGEPQVVFEATQPTFSSFRDVRFWLTLRNRWDAGCVPAFIDPILSAEAQPMSVLLPRPSSVVKLVIRTEHGKEVTPRFEAGAKARALRAHEVVLLWCGHEYGWEIGPARIPWGYDLSPGRYKARASITVPMASFFRARDGLQAELGSLWQLGDDVMRSYTRDLRAESAEVPFTVEPAK